jgi:hypothetical protein
VGFLTYPDSGGEGYERVEAGPLPDRVYARVDRFEPADLEGKAGSLLLDCVDADWFDEVGREVRWLADPDLADEVDRRISVIELEIHRDGRFYSPWRRRVGSWVELRLGSGGDDVLHYPNLFLPPVSRALSTLSHLPGALENDLRAKTGLRLLRDADPEALTQAIDDAGRVDAAAVYDVGQGGCSALLRDGLPRLYFDFGGAALSSTKTFPEALTRFCFSRSPPVVLSHWDWDHWSSARRDPRALERTWIVPRHDNQLGPVNTRFLGDLLAKGRVLVWPAGLPSARVGQVTISACTGPAGRHNDSGLAMTVAAPEGRGDGRMLFPGDAGYRFVPGSKAAFTSVVVPHHGGVADSSWVAGSDGAEAGRLVYSYGAGNFYRHPFSDVERAHKAAWPWRRTRHTALRGPEGLGHVHLYWDPGDAAATPRCNGRHCDLGCRQR